MPGLGGEVVVVKPSMAMPGFWEHLVQQPKPYWIYDADVNMGNTFISYVCISKQIYYRFCLQNVSLSTENHISKSS